MDVTTERQLKFCLYILLIFATAIMLCVAYPVEAIYTGNQYIYFFWGLKNAGVGSLANDVLATEPDPFPLFSLIVEFTARYLTKWFYYFWYWLVCLIYVVACFGIMRAAFSKVFRKSFWYLIIPLFILLHSTAIWSFFMRYAFNIDLRWLWDNGIATQGLLMGYFQPSSMGVFLLWSVERFLKSKTVFAVVLAALAGAFHANYLLLGGVLVGVYVVFQIKDKKWVQLGLSVALALILTLPYVWYVYQNFTTVGMSTEEVIAFQDALTAVRKDNPHLDPLSWINWIAGFKFLLVILALFLMRNKEKKKVFYLYFPLVVITVVLSLVVLVSGNNFLINMAPWRMSVILVPIATAVLLSYMVKYHNMWAEKFLLILGVLSLAVLYYRFLGNRDMLMYWRIAIVIGVLAVLPLQKRFKGWVCFDRSDLFFASAFPVFILGIFTHLTEVNEKSKVGWRKFTGLPKEGVMYLIPPDNTHFRLDVGVPVLVDNNLYFSRNLADWQKRKEMADWFYSLSREEKKKNFALFREIGVTHWIDYEEGGGWSSMAIDGMK